MTTAWKEYVSMPYSPDLLVVWSLKEWWTQDLAQIRDLDAEQKLEELGIR